MNPIERRIDVGEVTLNVATVGEGPPVVLLHGWPEFWWSWRHQMDALAKAGFTAIAPDLRGFNRSDKPAGVMSYRLERIEADVRGLIRALGHEKAHVVGHDWGGALAWSFGARQADAVDKLVIMNAPHPAIFGRKVLTPAQLKRSWYMFFFQLPFLPERATRSPSFMRRALRGMAVHKERFSDADIARFAEAYAMPGAATGALNYYRAAFRTFRERVKLPRIERPTLVVWGERDTALGTDLLDGLDRHVANLRVHRIADSSHWVQQDTPDEVNRVLVEFLRG